MALAATIVWEVRSGGSDNNGGGFNSAAAGTDRTLQNSAQVAIDNATITTSITANVITFTGYSPTSADVGNVVQMLTGTNVTAGFYEITGQTSSTWTVTGAASLPTSGTTTNATGNMGGALATPGKARGAAVASNTVFIKNSSGASPDSFTCSNSSNVAGGRITDSTSSTGAAPSYTVGYESTRTVNNTDANWPILKATANSVTVVTLSGTQNHVRNVTATRNASETSVTGFSVNSTRGAADNCKADTVGTGFSVATAGRLQNCLATACQSVGFTTSAGCSLHGCVAKGTTAGNGFNLSGTGQPVVVADCVASGNNTAGFTVAHANILCLNCTSYGNTSATGHGFDLNNASTTNGQLVNCVAYSNGGRNYNAGTATDVLLLNCAGGNGTTADNYASAQSVGFITLTADPFTNAAGNDFSLNTTSGGGASLRAAGKPGAYLGLSTTSAPDVGAAQTNVTTAGGAMGARIFTGM